MPKKVNVLRGKYQIKKNIYSVCTIYVVEANDHDIKAFIGIHRPGDQTIPIGTRIYLDSESINKILARNNQGFEVISIDVKAHENGTTGCLHVCSPIQKDRVADRRKKPRAELKFPVTVPESDIVLNCIDGTMEGLTLLCKSKNRLSSLNVDCEYKFVIDYKGKHYTFPVKVSNLQYDWKNFEHRIGVTLCALDSEQTTILNLVLDPDYELDISHLESIDPITGKVMKQ